MSGGPAQRKLPMTALPKIVFSSTLSEVEWSNARVSNWPVEEEEIPELKRQAEKDIVVFGDGLPLLHGLPEPLRLALVSSTAYADGAVTHTYA